jgi:hypothetical protein
MGADDDADCPEHEWQLMGVALVPGHGAPTEYACTRCTAVLYRGPDDPFPGTV